MKLRLIRIGLALGGNALGLWLASRILSDDMSVSGTAFVVAVVIFSVLTLVLEPLVVKVAEKWIDALHGGTALISTGIALLITEWVSDGLVIDGVGTWVLATVIVWGATLILGVILAKLFIKQAQPG